MPDVRPADDEGLDPGLKAILIVLDKDVAMDVARLIASTLTLNGYSPTKPEVIDWPLRTHTSEGTAGEAEKDKEIARLREELDYDPKDPDWGTKERSRGQLRRIIRHQHKVHNRMYQTIHLLKARLTAAEAVVEQARGWERIYEIGDALAAYDAAASSTPSRDEPAYQTCERHGVVRPCPACDASTEAPFSLDMPMGNAASIAETPASTPSREP